ncbi:MAG: hypothetical protein HOC74_39480 [Gemmatimonadetes bacterium]|jgi:hypothetical protein|nr:hypothetical protein [Gemmatimonadota bacterium]
MNHVHRAAWDIKLKAGNYMEGGLKRLGALFLKFWAVPMVPVGVGLMLYGLITKLESGYNLEDTFPVGVALTIFGALLWFLAKRLDAAARLVRYRRQQSRLVRLARERGGRLTVTEAAADADLTVEEAEEILKRLADGGYVEMEVTDSGLMVYRFPEILYGHEKPWSRGIESA